MKYGLLSALLGFWFLIHVKILKRQTNMTKEFVSPKITSMKNLQGNLRPVPILWNLPGTNYIYVEIMMLVNYWHVIMALFCILRHQHWQNQVTSNSKLTIRIVRATQDFHFSPWQMFGTFLYQDQLWQKHHLCLKCKHCQIAFIHHNRGSFLPFFPLIFRPFALLTMNNKSLKMWQNVKIFAQRRSHCSAT